jgi:hypothetical protein
MSCAGIACDKKRMRWSCRPRLCSGCGVLSFVQEMGVLSWVQEVGVHVGGCVYEVGELI